MSRGNCPSHEGFKYINNAIIGELESELKYSGLTDYTFNKEKEELIFRKPYNIGEIKCILRVVRICLLYGISVTIE